MKFYIRARSADSVRIALQLRSGDGSAAFRSNVVEKIVPGDLNSWTLLEYTFNAATIGGFDSTDFRDLWLYFDRGDDNFEAGIPESFNVLEKELKSLCLNVVLNEVGL